MSFTQSIATQIKRFACDRCHGQKLRCPRPADGSPHEPCIRCSKAGTQCSITTPLRVGRPNKSRKLNTGERLPSRTPSPGSKSLPTIKTLETKPLSESDSEDDQLGNPRNTQAVVDPTSRCSSVNLTPYNTSPAIGTTQFCDMTESASPMVMNDFGQYLDFDLDFTDLTDAMDMGVYDDDINMVGAKSLMSPEEEHPPVTVFGKTARQTCPEFATDGHIPEEIHCDTPPEEGAIHGFNPFPSQCLGRYTAYATLPGLASIQTSPTTLTPSTVPPPTPAKTPRPTEDSPAHPRPFFPSPLEVRDITSGSTNFSHAPSPPELTNSELPNRQLHEQKSLASLLHIQQQICDCSEEVMQPKPSHQDHSRALGRLFCATDRFIAHISGNRSPASPSTSISVSQSSTPSNYADCSSTHALVDPSISPPDPNATLGTSHHTFPLPSATVFYIIMACHARILAAYDTIISTTPPTRVFRCQSPTMSATSECCFSIGSFTVRSGTSLESLLHLQVISHQLDHLNSALYRYMMVDAASTSSSSSLLSRMGPGKSSSSSLGVRSSDKMQDFAVQMFEHQGIVLKGKLDARIAEM